MQLNKSEKIINYRIMKQILLLLTIILLFSCKHQPEINDQLVAYWSFDDTISKNIIECSGSGLVTINRGANQVNGYKGKGMQFDGVSVLQVEYNPLLDSFPGGITVAAWIKKDTASHWNTIVSREIDSTWSEYIGLAVVQNHPLFSVDPDGGKYINVKDPASVTPDKWVHLAGTFNNDTLKLFVNGYFIKSDVCKSPFTFRDKNPLFIGGNSNNKNLSVLDCFKGCIDEVRIYRRALSENEIKLLIKQ
jgi:hypothetical protein